MEEEIIATILREVIGAHRIAFNNNNIYFSPFGIEIMCKSREDQRKLMKKRR